MSKPSILMVAGERSGDIYGAELAKVIRERLGDVEIFGCGGEAMRQAGVETIIDAGSLTMVGITEVFMGLPRVYQAFGQLVEEVKRRKPQLAIPIDFPDFNLRLAKKLKPLGIRVAYFVSPQVWAWRSGRVNELKASIDKMFCIFDFEQAIYQKAGVPVEYVGHPLVDMVKPHLTREEFYTRAGLDPKVTTVALLPGSRQQEVITILPRMLDAATLMSLKREVQFVVAVAPSLDAAWLEKAMLECYVGRATVRAVTHATYDALQHADVAVVASGTATVEATLRERPMVVVYCVAPLTWLAGKLLVDVPFYSMVNILAGKRLVPELMQSEFSAHNVASHVEYLLDHAEARESMVTEFRSIKARLGTGGAIRRAAEAMLQLLPASIVAVRAS